MIPEISWRELALLVGVGVLLFGSKRIPDAAKALGRTVNAFKKGLHEEDPSKDDPEKKP